MNKLLNPRILLFLKYGFFFIVVGGIFFMIFPVLRISGDYAEDDTELLVENFTQPYMAAECTLKLLQNDAPSCLKMRLNSFGTKSVADGWQNSRKNNKELYKSFIKFEGLLKTMNVKAAIIEPSVLYCMLQDNYKDLLRKRLFNITKFWGSTDVLTVGVLEDDAYKLQQEDVASKFQRAGFQKFTAYTRLTEWMQKKDSMLSLQAPPSHLFYVHNNHAFHLVVFYGRRNYFWHAAVYGREKVRIPGNSELLFDRYDSAYEKFSLVPVLHAEPSFRIYIPSSPHYFLFQMMSSRFLECEASRSANMTSDHPRKHDSLSVEEFNLRTFIAIHQLKAIFQPLLVNLWIWSGTMLGWYRQCDIIPYTTDADFAAWADEVQDLEGLIDQFSNNQYVSIKARMGVLTEALEFQLDCKKLRVDIFFMYRIENGSWCSGHKPSMGYYFRYYYPPFSLCSAELLDEKVQVPCQTKDVIVNEYGRDWSKPKSDWHYETSIKNRGPNIYWTEKHLKDAYKFY